LQLYHHLPTLGDEFRRGLCNKSLTFRPNRVIGVFDRLARTAAKAVVEVGIRATRCLRAEIVKLVLRVFNAFAVKVIGIFEILFDDGANPIRSGSNSVRTTRRFLTAPDVIEGEKDIFLDGLTLGITEERAVVDALERIGRASGLRRSCCPRPSVATRVGPARERKEKSPSPKDEGFGEVLLLAGECGCLACRSRSSNRYLRRRS
jgi:hypothetical protein